MSGKVYLVAGSTGIAADAIQLLLEAGNYVFYVSDNVFHCEDLLDEINTRGFDADYMVGDMRNEAFIRELVGTCVNTHGHIDGLFNVSESRAGNLVFEPLDNSILAGWPSTSGNSLTAQLGICKHVTNLMIEKQPLICSLLPEPDVANEVLFLLNNPSLMVASQNLALQAV
jgi:NAD(P)-dependent dehydrogenase (short-subunit alcohol dehydrogenase family)